MFYELVRPALLAMMGRKDGALRRSVGRLTASIRKRTSRLELVRALFSEKDGTVTPLSKQDSHMLSGLAKANCLIRFPEERKEIESGEEVEIEMLPEAAQDFFRAGASEVSSPDGMAKGGAVGHVVAVSVSRKKGLAKTNVPSARLVEAWGIEGDVHAGEWHRQVSLLAVESIEKMRAKGLNVGPGAFAENITTESIDLPELQVGDRVRIGASELEITQIGKECHSRCEIYYRAGDCVMPREGIFARVRKGGQVRKGDMIEVSKRDGPWQS
jgi:MOSC domain-containing protein YiiM